MRPPARWADALAHLADPLPLLAMLAAACGIALLRGRPREALAALVVVAGANLTTQVLKVAPRPPALPAAPRRTTSSARSPSPAATPPRPPRSRSPSLFVVPRRLRPLTAVLGAGLVFAVGCSVMVLAWHYPSDVLGGILVAAGWGFAVLAALRALAARGPRAPSRSAQASSRAAISVK